MDKELPLGQQLSLFWTSIASWIAEHTTRITISALIAAALVALLYGVRLVGIRLSKTPNEWRGIIGRALASMRPWFMIALAAQIIAVYARAPEDIAQLARLGFVVTFTFQAALFLREFILGVVERRADEADPSGSLGSALSLIRLLISVTLFLIAIILILSNLGVNVTGLVAGLGVGGIAIGLAAQGIFSDLFAALSILFDKPFRRGDTVRWDMTTGIVELIGLKSTRIRAVSGEEIIVSNTNLLSKELRNLARNDHRRITQTLSLIYQTSAKTCADLPDVLRKAVDGVDGCTFVHCVLDGFAPSSIDFHLVYDIATDNLAMIAVHKHAANIAILNTFAAHGIQFAYPTQTTFTAAPDGTLVMPWAALASTG